MALTNYLKAALQDFLWRKQPLTIPDTIYTGLIGGANFPNDGKILRSTVYTVGQYAWPSTPNGRLYKVTTAGTTGVSEPAWTSGSAITDGGTVTDGTVVWTEQTLAIEAGAIPEPSGNAYARQPITRSLATIMGTNLAASAGVSSGPSGVVSVLAQIAFPVCTPSGNGPIWGQCLYDAASAGNPLAYGALDVPRKLEANDQFLFPGGVANSSHGQLKIVAD